MKKLKLWIDTGYAGCDYNEVFEVPDDITVEECEEEARMFLFYNIDFGYELESEE